MVLTLKLISMAMCFQDANSKKPDVRAEHVLVTCVSNMLVTFRVCSTCIRCAHNSSWTPRQSSQASAADVLHAAAVVLQADASSSLIYAAMLHATLLLRLFIPTPVQELVKVTRYHAPVR
jgi:hypothetical protein